MAGGLNCLLKNSRAELAPRGSEKMHQLIGITGSSFIGIDPFHPRSWSGSSRRFFLECNQRGLLNRALGVEVSFPVKCWYMVRNYSPERSRWSWKRLSDSGYRDSLTRVIQAKIEQTDYSYDFLQLGALYDVPRIVNGRSACYSYNDGNLAIALQSPYFPSGISRAQIERTLEYEREVNRGLDIIFTMSEYLRRSFIADFGIVPQKVISIGAGINIDMPTIEEHKDYSKASILFIGVDFARKGGYDVLKAFRRLRQSLPQATLHVVGPSKPPHNLAGMAGAIWHGFLDKSNEADALELDRLFREATLFVMPSLYEPFGIAPLEAMSHQIPCVTSSAWALPEIAPDHICGRLVDPGNHEQLAEVLIELLRDPTLLKRYGEAGREHVKEKYTWAKVVERLHAILAARNCEATLVPNNNFAQLSE